MKNLKPQSLKPRYIYTSGVMLKQTMSCIGKKVLQLPCICCRTRNGMHTDTSAGLNLPWPFASSGLSGLLAQEAIRCRCNRDDAGNGLSLVSSCLPCPLEQFRQAPIKWSCPRQYQGWPPGTMPPMQCQTQKQLADPAPKWWKAIAGQTCTLQCMHQQ